MKVDSLKLVRKMRKLPDVARVHLVKAIQLGTEEGARVAKTLAPNVTGETRGRITTEYHGGGLIGEVVVIPSDASRAEKDAAYAIEHGRKKGAHGTTEGFHYVRTTRQFLATKNKRRMLRAVKKAVKEVASGG